MLPFLGGVGGRGECGVGVRVGGCGVKMQKKPFPSSQMSTDRRASEYLLKVMEVNVVKIPDDTDFARLRTLCDETEGWTLVHNKKGAKVWTKPCQETTFSMIRARADFTDVESHTAYDVLHDPHYRYHWDKYMLDSKDIGMLGPNNDLCYYSVRSPPPLRHRDFVLQRSWLDLGNELMIFNHSVCHDDYLPQKGCVRAISFLTGYLIRPLANPSSCQVTYVTQSDPRGKLPSWLINRVTHVITPRMMKKLHKACVAYPAWKAQNRPDWRPWSRPDQQPTDRVDLSRCQPRDYGDVVDESQLTELDDSSVQTNGKA